MIINIFIYFNINKKYLEFVLIAHFTVMIIIITYGYYWIINIISNISSLQIIITNN